MGPQSEEGAERLAARATHACINPFSSKAGQVGLLALLACYWSVGVPRGQTVRTPFAARAQGVSSSQPVTTYLQSFARWKKEEEAEAEAEAEAGSEAEAEAEAESEAEAEAVAMAPKTPH